MRTWGGGGCVGGWQRPYDMIFACAAVISTSIGDNVSRRVGTERTKTQWRAFSTLSFDVSHCCTMHTIKRMFGGVFSSC